MESNAESQSESHLGSGNSNAGEDITDNKSVIGNDVIEKAWSQLKEGKRNLACDEVTLAVEALAEACELLAKAFGDNADEVAEAYFYYGKALLEVARADGNVLGNGIHEDAEESSNSSDQEECGEAPPTEESTVAKSENVACSGTASVTAPIATVSAEPLSAKIAEVQNDQPGQSASEKGEVSESTEKTGEDEDVSSLQVAWEVLELAKGIYSRGSDKVSQLKLADVYLTLGEVGLESEQYDQAVLDINSCLTIQSQHLEPHDRLLAETHYQLGMSHLLQGVYKPALLELAKAKTVLEKRISILESQVSSGEKDNVKLHKEIEELRQLIPDIVAKIEDIVDEAKTAQLAQQQIQETISRSAGATTSIGFGPTNGASTSTACTIQTKPNDISSLVRKRKSENDVSGTSNGSEMDSTKKAKVDIGHTADHNN